MRRFIRWFVVTALVQTFVLVVLQWILPGFDLGEWRDAVLSAVVISLFLALAWPFIYFIAARFHPILFPILTFVLTGFIVYLVGQVDVEGFQVDSVWIGIVVSLGLTIGNVLIGALFRLTTVLLIPGSWFVRCGALLPRPQP